MVKHRSSKKPQSAGDILEGMFKRSRLDQKLKRYEGFSYWPEVVGAKWAEISYPARLTRGRILVVRVIDSAWMQELSLHKQQILDRLHELNKGATIEDLRFESGNPEEFRHKKENS